MINLDEFYERSAFVKATGISKKDFAEMWGRIIAEIVTGKTNQPPSEGKE